LQQHQHTPLSHQQRISSAHITNTHHQSPHSKSNMNNNTFSMPDHEYSTPFYNQNHQAQPSTIQPLVLNLDYSQVSSPTSSFQQLDSSSPGWSSATSVAGSPCDPLLYGSYDVDQNDINTIIDDRHYYGPTKYSYDFQAESGWASSSCASDSFWMEEPPQILKSNIGIGLAVHQDALGYGPISSQTSIGVLGLPSGTMLSPEWSVDHKVNNATKSTTSRRKKQAKKSSYKLSNGAECDVSREEKPRWICEHVKDGKPCGRKFRRQEHRKRHWDAGCKHTDSDKEAPRCVIELHCAVATCKELKGKRPDNMVQHIATHLKGGPGGRNKAIDADFLFYCLCRHDAETGVTVSKAAAKMMSAIDINWKASGAKSHRVDRALMEQHAWWQDYQRERSAMRSERRAVWTAELEHMYRQKAMSGGVQKTRSRWREAKL